MNGQTEFACRAASRVSENKSLETGIANSVRDAGAPELLLHSGPELSAPHRQWSQSLRGYHLVPQNGPSNEFMTVLSHELRNSLGAIRSAAGVLRMEISAGPAAVRARAVIERQVGQMTRLVEDLLDV